MGNPANNKGNDRGKRTHICDVTTAISVCYIIVVSCTLLNLGENACNDFPVSPWRLCIASGWIYLEINICLGSDSHRLRHTCIHIRAGTAVMNF